MLHLDGAWSLQNIHKRAHGNARMTMKYQRENEVSYKSTNYVTKKQQDDAPVSFMFCAFWNGCSRCLSGGLLGQKVLQVTMVHIKAI